MSKLNDLVKQYGGSTGGASASGSGKSSGKAGGSAGVAKPNLKELVNYYGGTQGSKESDYYLKQQNNRLQSAYDRAMKMVTYDRAKNSTMAYDSNGQLNPQQTVLNMATDASNYVKKRAEAEQANMTPEQKTLQEMRRNPQSAEDVQKAYGIDYDMEIAPFWSWLTGHNVYKKTKGTTLAEVHGLDKGASFGDVVKKTASDFKDETKKVADSIKAGPTPTGNAEVDNWFENQRTSNEAARLLSQTYGIPTYDIEGSRTQQNMDAYTQSFENKNFGQKLASNVGLTAANYGLDIVNAGLVATDAFTGGRLGTGTGQASSVYQLTNFLQNAGTGLAAQGFESMRESSNWLGKLIVDLERTSVEQMMDRAFGPESLIAMGVRVFGAGAQEAEDRGESLRNQVLTGAGRMAVEVGTEMLGGVGGSWRGTGYGDAFFGKLDKWVASKTGSELLGTLASAFGSETVEELLADVLNPLVDRIFGIGEVTGRGEDKTFMQKLGSFLTDVWGDGQFLYDGLLGGLAGMLGGAGTYANPFNGITRQAKNLGVDVATYKAAERIVGFDRLKNQFQEMTGVELAEDEGTALTQVAVYLTNMSATTGDNVRQVETNLMNRKAVGGEAESAAAAKDMARLDYAAIRKGLDTLEMNSADETALMTGYKTGNATAQEYVEGVRQAFTAGRIGLSLTQARKQFPDTKLSRKQFENAFNIGQQNKTPDVAGAKAKIDGRDYSIRMKGSDTVVFKAADGSTLEMTRTEALTRDGVSIPEEVVKLIHATEQFGANAGEIYNLYTGNMGIESYAAAMNSAIHWAENGVLRQRIESGRALGQRTNLTRLTDEQIALAEKIGEAHRTERKASAKARADSLNQKEAPKGRKGRVIMNGAVTARGEKLKGIDLKNLNKQQKDAVRAIRTMVNLVQIDYIIYDGVRAGTGATGSEAEESWGFYEDGKVYININAGTGNDYIAVATLAHELTHFIQDLAGNEYEQLRDEIIRIYYNNDPAEFERVVQLRMETGGENGKTLSHDAAVDEVIANSCMEMLNDSNAIDQLCADNPTLGQKILNFLKQLIKDIFGDINRIPFRENAFYQAHYDAFTNARDLFAAGLKKAAENARKGETAGNLDIQGGRLFMKESDLTLIAGENAQAKREAEENAYQEARSGGKGITVTQDLLKKYADVYESPEQSLLTVIREFYEANLDGTKVSASINGNTVDILLENDGKKKTVGWRMKPLKAATFEELRNLIGTSVYAYSEKNRNEGEAADIPFFHYFMNCIRLETENGMKELPAKIQVRDIVTGAKPGLHYYTHDTGDKKLKSTGPSSGESPRIAGNATDALSENSIADLVENSKGSDAETVAEMEAAEATGRQLSRFVEDPETLKFLEDQEKAGKVVRTYKSFLKIDGKLYPPMASLQKDENGKYKLAHAMEEGRWEESVGNPKNVIVDEKTGKGYFNLKKDNGKTVKAAYNPYQHSSNLMLNDQFEEAYQRPQLVTYECIIPESELTSGYRADYAKDAVGLHPWKAGPVAGKLKSGNQRNVYLSRWLKPVREVPASEVAQHYKQLLDGTDIAVPFNVVTPELLAELEKAGVKIDREGSPMYKARAKRNEAAQQERQYQRPDGQLENAIYLTDGHKANGETADFINEILDGRKKGETRTHNRLQRGWLGLAKTGTGQVFGRVKLGDPIEISKNSPEYRDAMIEGTEYDLKDGETKYYYPILEVEDFRDNPRPILRPGNYGRYEVAAREAETERKPVQVDAQNAQEEATFTEDGKTYPLRQYSLKSMEYDIQDGKMFDDLANYTSMSEQEIDDLRNDLRHLMDVIALHRDILDMNETYGKKDRPFKAFKPNSDPLYTLSLDFSTLCRKRLMTQYVIEKLQTELKDSETGETGRALSAEEQLAVRDLMKEYGKQEKALKVACAMCYVEAARLKAPKQINKFLRDPKSAMLRYFALKNKEFNDSVKKAQADFKVKKGYAANTAKKNMKPADVTALNKLSSKLRDEYGSKAHPASEEELEAIRIARSLPRTTFLTAANLAQLAEEHPVIYDAYTATIRTATRSKSLEADIPYYYGDSYGEVSDEFIRNVNAENGMRFSSWSDFQIEHMLDMMTAVIELSTRKCAMHGYTKFLEQVRIFGKTGMMFNMSGVPQGTGLKADGSLDFSPTESVLVKSEDGSEYDAITARNEFPETAGLQCIGISNEHILALLASDIIDYVIPYHTSGLNASLRRMAQISNWSDFTSFQNAAEDKSIKFDEAIHNKDTWHKEPVFSEFFNAAKDPANGYKEGEAGIETMRRAADIYKRMCAERGLRPKFSWGNSKVDADFSNDPNYWKLLIDRKMINQNTGKLIEQKPVTPTFDFGEIEKRVQEAVDAYDSTLQDRALGYVREHLSELPQRIKDLKKSGAVKKAKTDAKKADELSKRFNELQAGVVAAATEGSLKQAEADEKKARVYQKFDASVNQFNDGFYSKAEQVVTENMPGKMAGDQVIKFLTGKGVKAEEIRWSGLAQFLEGKKSVSKDEVLSFLQQNRVQVETKILDNSERERLLSEGYQHDPLANEDYPTREDFELAMKEQYGDEVTFTETEDFTATGDEPARELAYTNGPYYAALVDGRVVGYTERLEVDPYELEDDMFENGARWGKYTVEGGGNYREILFKFPGGTYYNDSSKAHWRTNAPGTFAHARVQDFKDDRGKRVLFVEEIQSDWHNAGAKGRFEGDNDAEYEEYSYLLNRLSSFDVTATPEENQRFNELRAKLIPASAEHDAAQKEFSELKGRIRKLERSLYNDRIMRLIQQNRNKYPNEMAAYYVSDLTNGQIRELTIGKFKADDLIASDRKIVEEYANRAFWEVLTEEERDMVTKYREIRSSLKKIEETYGKQVRKATSEATPDAPFAGNSDSYLFFVMKNMLRMAAEGGYDTIAWTPAEIQIDRWSDEFEEGYRIEYDQDLPKFMRKYGNQWGMKVGSTTLNQGTDEVWSVDLTDTMKQSVTQTGQPLFQKYDQMSFDDMGDDYSRSQWNAEYRQRIEIAEELTERVKNYLAQRGVDPEELEEYGARESYFNRSGDIAGAAYMIRILSDLSQEMNGRQRQEAYELMEELLPHAESEALGRYITDEGPINPDFARWYNDRNPSLYYPGYTPGDLMKSMANLKNEISYLIELLQRDDLTAEYRDDAEEFLNRLKRRVYGNERNVVFYQKYNPAVEETAEERENRNAAEIRAREEKQLLHETVVSLNQELKKLNWKLSGGNEVREDDCLKLARQYKKTYGSTVNTQELAAKIKALGDYIVSAEELDDARIRADAEAIAYVLIDSAREVEDMWSMRNQDLERHQDAAARIQGKKFYYPESLRGDLAREGGYNTFRRANMGRFTLSSKGGDSIDAFYTELHDTYPDLFPELTNEGDQIIRMAEIFEEAKPDMVNPFAYEDDNFLTEVANGIFEDVLGEGIRQKAPSLMARVNLTEAAVEDDGPALSGAELAQVQKDLAAIGKELEAVTAKADALEKRWETVSANEDLAQKKLAAAEDRIQRLGDVLRRESQNGKLTEQQRKDAQAALKKAMAEKAKLEKLLQKAKENTAQVRQERNEIRKGRREAEQKRDSLQRQLNRATARNAALQVKLSDNAQRTRDRLAALRAEKNARIEQIRAEGAAKAEEIRATEKAEKWARVASERERYQEMARRARERRIEAQTRGTLRKRITKIYNEFVRDITHPTEGHHVPPEMMRQAVDVLQALNMDTSREGTKSGERLREKLAKLKVTYDAIQNDKDFRNAAVYDETVSEMLQAMIEEVGDTPINRMTGRQMESVYNVLVAMRTTARTALKIKMQGEERDAYEVARKMTGEVRSGQKPSRGVAGAYLNTQLTPERMFNRLGGYHKDNTWSQVYRMLNEGQLESTRIFVEGSRIFEKLLNSKDYDGYVSPKNTVDIGLKDEDGNAVPVTHDMLVSLWMHLQNEDNTRHAILGGLTIPNQKQYYAGNRARGSEEAVRVLGSTLPELKRALELREQAQQTEDMELKRELWKEIGDLREKAMSHATTLYNKVADSMTAYDRQWAEALTELFDVYSKEQLNKTTMEVYGIKRASVEHYWPINVDGDFLNTPFESVAKDFSIENAGFMKERVNSSKPIRLVGSSDVASSQLRKVSQYSGLMPVIRSFNKIWGKTQIGYQDSLKNAVHTIYGDTGVKYIENLMADLNGARIGQESPFGQALNKMRGNMAQAALTLSMRTAFGQTASYPTAAAVVGWKPLMKAFAKGGKYHWMFSRADRELIEQYSPLLRYRSMGYSTTELGDISTSNSRMARLWKKMRWMTGWIQAMDSATVGRLWYAAEYYVDDHNKALKKGTDAYYEEVARVFNDIVEKTQPDYTTMQRPDILRNPNALVRSLTMFMTQRLQNANIMYDAAATLSQMKKDYAAGTYGVTKEDVQQAAVNTRRAATSLLVAGVTITAFKFLADVVLHSMNAYRDDDKDLTGESVGLQLTDMFLDSMIGNLLFGSEVYKLVESKVFGKTYYGIEVSGVSTVSDVAEDMSKLFDKIRESGFKVGEYKGELNKMAKDVAQLLGLPLSNGEKIVMGIINHGRDIANGEFFSFEAGVERKTSQNARRLYNAYERGDERTASEILEEAEDKKALRSELTKYIKTLYKEGEISAEEATDQLTEYAEIWRADAEREIKKITFQIDYGFEYDDIRERYLSGEMTASEAKSAMVKYGGKSETAAADDLAFWKEKDAFDKRYGTEYEYKYSLSYSGAKAYYTKWRNLVSLEKFAQQWEKYGNYVVTDYYEKWRATGLTIDQYSIYKEGASKCKGTDLDHDGKTDSGSKKAEVLKVIDALPVSSEVKDAIYEMNGWSMKWKYLKEAPWH